MVAALTTRRQRCSRDFRAGTARCCSPVLLWETSAVIWLSSVIWLSLGRPIHPFTARQHATVPRIYTPSDRLFFFERRGLVRRGAGQACSSRRLAAADHQRLLQVRSAHTIPSDHLHGTRWHTSARARHRSGTWDHPPPPACFALARHCTIHRGATLQHGRHEHPRSRQDRGSDPQK